MKTTRLLRFAALAALAAAFVAPAAANASDVRNIAIHTNALGVLDVAGGSTAAGAKVIQYPVTGGANQRWDVIGSHIISVKSQLCLTTSGTSGAQLYVTYCNAANPRQDWRFGAEKLETGLTGYIDNPATGLALDVQGSSGLAGTPIIGYPLTRSWNQQFTYFFWN